MQTIQEAIKAIVIDPEQVVVATIFDPKNVVKANLVPPPRTSTGLHGKAIYTPRVHSSIEATVKNVLNGHVKFVDGMELHIRNSKADHQFVLHFNWGYPDNIFIKLFSSRKQKVKKGDPNPFGKKFMDRRRLICSGYIAHDAMGEDIHKTTLAHFEKLIGNDY